MNTNETSGWVVRGQTPGGDAVTVGDLITGFLADCAAAISEFFAMIARLFREYQEAYIARKRREEPLAVELTDLQVWKYC